MCQTPPPCLKKEYDLRAMKQIVYGMGPQTVARTFLET